MSLDKIYNYNFHKITNKKIKILYDLFLKYLSNELNRVHSEKYKPGEWEIFIGHWLQCYTRKLVRSFNSKKENIKNKKQFEEIYICHSSYDFQSLSSQSSWNNKFNYHVKEISRKKKIKINKLKIFKSHETNDKNSRKFKSALKKIYFFFFRNLFKKYKIVIFNTYLGKFNDFLLQLKFNLIPLIDLPNNFKKNSISKKFRENMLLKNFSKIKNFERFKYLLIFHLPSNFLENYKNLKKFVNKNYPKKTNVIFNSNESITDDAIKYWIMCQKVENKSKLLIFEHGLNYGVVNDYYPQYPKIELKYTNHIFTWGNTKIKKSIPMFVTSRKKFEIIKKKKLILIFNQCQPDYHYIENKEYFEKNFNLIKFYKHLDSNIKNDLLVRLHKTNFEPYSENVILHKLKRNKKFKKIEIDNGKNSISETLKNSKLLVFLYPSTGFFEALKNNIPCLMLWKNFQVEINNLAKNDFEYLIKNKIIFTDEVKLTKKINMVWNDVDKWWNEEKRKKDVKRFNNKYLKYEFNLNKIYIGVKNLI